MSQGCIDIFQECKLLLLLVWFFTTSIMFGWGAAVSAQTIQGFRSSKPTMCCSRDSAIISAPLALSLQRRLIYASVQDLHWLGWREERSTKTIQTSSHPPTNMSCSTCHSLQFPVPLPFTASMYHVIHQFCYHMSPTLHHPIIFVFIILHTFNPLHTIIWVYIPTPLHSLDLNSYLP